MTSVLVAILAAGESRRMGSPKLCLPWNGTTVLDHLLRQWHEAGAEKILVIHPSEDSSPVVQELERLKIPTEMRAPTGAFERGMMGSVVTAAGRGLRDSEISHLIIALGDQPHLRRETLQRMLEVCGQHPEKIIRTVFQGKSGHPLALPASLLPDLASSDSASLRDFLDSSKSPACNLTCNDSGVLLDVDTPADYQEMRRHSQ